MRNIMILVCSNEIKHSIVSGEVYKAQLLIKFNYTILSKKKLK